MLNGSMGLPPGVINVCFHVAQRRRKQYLDIFTTCNITLKPAPLRCQNVSRPLAGKEINGGDVLAGFHAKFDLYARKTFYHQHCY